jgi:hypothetical protein
MRSVHTAMVAVMNTATASLRLLRSNWLDTVRGSGAGHELMAGFH